MTILDIIVFDFSFNITSIQPPNFDIPEPLTMIPLELNSPIGLSTLFLGAIMSYNAPIPICI